MTGAASDARAPRRRFVVPEPDPALRYLWVHTPGARGVCGFAMTRERGRRLVAAGYLLRRGAAASSPQVDP